METVKLREKKCVPCEGNEKPLSADQALDYNQGISDRWKIIENNNKIHRIFKFKNFAENMAFVNRVAKLAEEEGHHPDMCISYDKLEIELTTHAISGLSENDFIVASKIDAID